MHFSEKNKKTWEEVPKSFSKDCSSTAFLLFASY